MRHSWDPDLYLRHADERGRPFLDLLARVPSGTGATGDRPTRVADLGCGPGTLTRLLLQRWPGARLTAVDSSPAMVRAAREQLPADAEVVEADLRDWQPEEPVDLLVSNATLQWLPDHLDLLPRLLRAVAPGGHLAVQVPGNHDAPSHALRRELAADPRFAPHLLGPDGAPMTAEPRGHDPRTYLEVLAADPAGRELVEEVDTWETTYTHLLHGPDPVLTWVLGTGARPMVEALPEPLRAEFTAELGERLSAAYPPGPLGTALPFRRVFLVVRRAASPAAPAGAPAGR